MSSLQEMKIATDGQNRPKTPIYWITRRRQPTDPRVVERCAHFHHALRQPASRNHSYGGKRSRQWRRRAPQVAAIIGADEKEIHLHLRRDRIEKHPLKAGAFLQGQETTSSRW
jgi:hypothetical protein